MCAHLERGILNTHMYLFRLNLALRDYIKLMHHSPVMVINNNMPVSSRAELEFLYRSIFPGRELDHLHQNILDLLFQQPGLMTSHAHVVAGLKFLLNNSLQSDPEQVVLRELLAELWMYESQSYTNGRVYNPATFSNPCAVWWPDPTAPNAWMHNPRSIYQELPYARTYSFIDKQTPIGSAGSCFAMEIYKRLKASGFNYVTTEPNPHSCAKWGVIFNIPAFRQLIQKSFGLITLPRLLWKKETETGVEYRDPFREEVAFESVEQYQAEYDAHLQAAREALLRVKVFILTLGLNEIWALRADPRVVFSRNPWNFSPFLTERRTLSFEESLRELQTMLDIWRSFNPDLKLILSVSPVPLMGTFQARDMHVIEATCHAKSLLRIVAHEFAARNQDVYYFPSFETVMYCTENPWDPDQRHVAPHTVDNVMRLFDKMFVAEGFSVRDMVRTAPESEPVTEGEITFSGPCLLAMVSPQVRSAVVQLLTDYAQAFAGHPPVNLLLWFPPEQGLNETQAAEWLEQLLADSDLDPDHMPDLHLYCEPLNHLSPLLHWVQAVVLTAQPEADLLWAWTQTVALEIPAIQSSPLALQQAWQKGREMIEMSAICQQLRLKAARIDFQLRGFYLDQIAVLQAGFRQFVLQGQFDQRAYESMRFLTYATQGELRRQILSRYPALYPPVFADERGSALGDLQTEAVLEQVASQGYEILPVRLSPSICQEIYDFARPLKGNPVPAHPEGMIAYNPEEPQATTLWLPEAEFLTCPAIQRLLLDPGLLNLVRHRLGFEPVLSTTGLWWTTPFGGEPSSESAQLYHMDMDHPCFFHVFFYLTDVDTDAGPHCYVRGSYQERPDPLWRDGRIRDDEVSHYYSAEDLIEVLGPRGTILVGETHSLHKGKALRRGERLMMQFVFAASLFGADVPQVSISRKALLPAFAAAIESNPRLFQRLKVVDA
jgi:hypothetical protein